MWPQMTSCEPELLFSLFYIKLNTQYWIFPNLETIKLSLVKLYPSEKVSSLAVKSRAWNGQRKLRNLFDFLPIRSFWWIWHFTILSKFWVILIFIHLDNRALFVLTVNAIEDAVTLLSGVDAAIRFFAMESVLTAHGTISFVVT